MWKIIVLCTIVCLAAAQKATFNNYKVFRIIPTTEEQVNNLQQLQAIYDGFSFWTEPSFVGANVDLMVAPHKLPEFYELMTRIDMPYQVYIEDVQKLIDQTTPKQLATSFDFKNYHTLEVIYKNLDDLAKQYPDKVEVIVGGRSYENRQIKGVKVSFKANNPGIFIEGGIHAREWISPATVMYILHQLLTSNDPDVRDLAESHDWYIFPVYNPDGYAYTHTTNRLWRKTRKPYGICVGADANRNWDYHWESNILTRHACSPIHAGSEPFSEIETKSMSEYIKSVSDKFYSYISFHSFSQLLMYPYGYTKEQLENYKDLDAIGLKSAAALKQKYGTLYRVGNVADTIYKCTGISVDYIKGIYHTPIVYTYELRDTGSYGFLLPPDQIIPSGEETLDSLVAMFKEVKARGYLTEN
ncbi:zinc carboxypeptidase [Solenopsis invicta]|uniref:zinc carboxypeptidase n=1 Tax=Solenopsis invicta TaxID=13686 RepID=UPI000596243B|nr:zinc carboxypeptidase [Solenopsis invicta]XP_039309768.1 zinc carboxypeptidase [Solenopsis invicta]XP_039309770.1 zinc carboxypeptidase [Solenopsis invicta]